MTPARLQQLLEEAVAHHGAGRLDQAEKIYRQMRADAPPHFDVLLLSGTLALDQGRPAEAADLLAAALPLNPRSAVCAVRLALALATLGRLVDAETHLRVAVRRQPDLPEAWDHLGDVLRRQGRLGEAVPCHQRAVALKPNFASGWHHLGLVLHDAGRLTDSLAAHDRALALAPPQARLHHGRALTLLRCHRLAEAATACEAALACDPGHADARSLHLFILTCSGGLTREELFAEHRAYAAALPAAAENPPMEQDPAERKLRVAFLSFDLRGQPGTCFLEPIVAHLDRAEFDVLLYHDRRWSDDTARRLQAHASSWRDVTGLSHEAVEAALRVDAPDIVVDLAGHGLVNRLPVLARRVATLQASYLGYPGTSGLAAVDCRFTDEVADPAGATDEWHTERLVRFAPTAWAYQPPAAAPAPAPQPPCVENGHVTFGCFGDFGLAGDETIAAWAALLDAVRDSRLRLKVSGLAESAVAVHARERLRRLGIAEERLELVDRTPVLADHLAHLQGIDVALDTFPCHGAAATCEALWMGVPVVTLAGGNLAARVGASLLTAAGHREWIARDWHAYVRIAAGLAGHPDGLARLRGALRGELKQSALLDHAGQAARLGAALRDAWRSRAGHAPAAFAF